MPRPRWIKELALKRISKLFEEAEKQFKEHPERSNRYMELAHKLSEKYNITLPREKKKKFCPKCFTYWVPGKTVKVRADTENKRMIYKCSECGEQRTYGYSKKTN